LTSFAPKASPDSLLSSKNFRNQRLLYFLTGGGAAAIYHLAFFLPLSTLCTKPPKHEVSRRLSVDFVFFFVSFPTVYGYFSPPHEKLLVEQQHYFAGK
jgi:hypothetical protein